MKYLLNKLLMIHKSGEEYHTSYICKIIETMLVPYLTNQIKEKSCLEFSIPVK